MRVTNKILALLLAMLMISTTAIYAFAEEKQTINNVYLSVTEPAVGEAPDTNIVSSEPDKYTVKYCYWIQRLGGKSFETFEAGVEYALVFEVYPVDGYKFAATQKDEYSTAYSATTVYVNGVQAEYCMYEYETKLGRAFVVTPTEEEEKPVSFFQRIINSIKNFFAKISDFFKKLFGAK